MAAARLNGDVLPEPDARAAAALADDLSAAGYASAAVRAAWGDDADDAIARGLHRPALRALGERRDPLAVLARLFVLGVPQPAPDVAGAVPTAGLDGLVQLGLVADAAAAGDPAGGGGRSIRPLVLIRPQSFADAGGEVEWWIASDLDEAALGGSLPVEHVLGVGGASRTLAGIQLPTPTVSVLDMGTGCGIQALRARRHAETVLATDISERALRFTRLNALLNGVTDIVTARGTLFEPARDEAFDRIVSNPPFVITPRRDGVPEYEYRDGGMVGDALVEAVIAGVGARLKPGGVAQLLGNWESRGDVDGLDRVRGWVARSPVPLDAWVIARENLDPIAYAELWIRDGGTVPSDPAFAGLMDAWLDDFATRDVTEVGFGYVLLRRPVDGTVSLSRYEAVWQSLGDEAIGGHLAAALAAHDRATALDDAGIAASVLKAAPDVTEARHQLPGAEDPTVIELRQGGGFARTLSVDPALAGLVGACDGDLPVGVLIDAIAQLLEVDAVELRADLLPRVRELLFTGFLVFA
ncbi:Ribosomal protein L11 methyltransferase [Microbacterium lemovicicum]|uniref:Ribosomal protein L11 methyltransferase n=1 Tax=Microbacterium lemovicicum TaxID=1072463 RepID=A0A3Q9J2W0_9MICO|nr:Ribosomal protein L11 methyltransferase [Microbacterium lemovicicum]